MKLQIAFLTFLLLLLFGNKTYACKCADKPSVSNSWQQAKLVFTGHIEKVENYSATDMKFTIRIAERFKLGIYKSANTRTFIGREGTCDFIFEQGKDYLIYTNEAFNLRSSICSRTVLLKNAKKEELEQLRKLYKDFKTSEEPRHSKIDNKTDVKKQNPISTNQNIKREPHSFVYTYFGTGVIFMLILAYFRRALFRL